MIRVYPKKRTFIFLMDTVESSNIKDVLFSKDTISNLNKKLLEKFNLNDINKDSKKKVIDLLIKNMKTVYRALDLKKITKKNFNSIFAQYNKACLDQTSAELGRAEMLQNIQPDASQLKQKRDFESNPNSGNKIMERPKGVSNKSLNQSNFLYPPGMNTENKNRLDSKFDNLFKPIVDNVDDNYKFNQYQYGRGGEDFTQKLDQFMSERTNESAIPKRPSTPDFLKPIQTSSRQEMPQNERKQNQNQNQNLIPGGGINAPMPVKRNGGKPNFSQEIPKDEFDTAFMSANENDADLYNINNIDKPMDIPNIEEDSRPFEQRLKSLEMDRSNVAMHKEPKNKINFQDPNLIMDDDLIPDYQPKSIDEIRREKTISQRDSKDFSRNELDDRRKQMMEPRERDIENDPRRNQKLDLEKEFKRRELENNSRRQDENNSRRQDENNYKRRQMEEISSTKIQDTTEEEELRQQGRVLSEETFSNSKSEMKSNINMRKVEAALKKLTKVTPVDDKEIIELKKENELLKKKLNDNDKFDFIKKELTQDFQRLSEKEKNIAEKEEEMEVLLKKYNYIYGIKNIQMDISPSIPKNDYVHHFDLVKNIIGIKLMSYSIPQPRYNIEENKNNLFKISVDGEEKEFVLKTGKYKIEDVLAILANKSGLNFKLNFEEKVEISSEKNFDIIPTALSNEVLGLINPCSNENNYVAEKTWDLRIEDKIYLFINNIEEKMPLAVLYVGNQAVQQFRFEEPISINCLELHFKDSKARPYNFYNLSYNLNLQLELSEPSN